MIVVLFKVTCRPDTIEQALDAFREVVAPSRDVEGVIAFDIARDLVDPQSIIATEVFEDRAALDRQESLPQVQKVIGMLGDVVAGEPEVTVYAVSGVEPYDG